MTNYYYDPESLRVDIVYSSPDQAPGRELVPITHTYKSHPVSVELPEWLNEHLLQFDPEFVDPLLPHLIDFDARMIAMNEAILPHLSEEPSSDEIRDEFLESHTLKDIFNPKSMALTPVERAWGIQMDLTDISSITYARHLYAAFFGPDEKYKSDYTTALDREVFKGAVRKYQIQTGKKLTPEEIAAAKPGDELAGDIVAWAGILFWHMQKYSLFQLEEDDLKNFFNPPAEKPAQESSTVKKGNKNMLTPDQLKNPPMMRDLFEGHSAAGDPWSPRIRDVQEAAVVYVEGVSDSRMSASIVTGETGGDDDHTALVQIVCEGSDGLLNASVKDNVISFYGRDHGEYNVGVLARLFLEIGRVLEERQSTEGHFSREMKGKRVEILFGNRSESEDVDVEPETQELPF
jgi:hypothetical protein